MYIDKLDEIINKYNNTYYSTIKMKSVDVKWNTCINSSKEINNKDPKFKINDIVRISKYKNIVAKSCTPNFSEDIFVVEKVKNTVPWIYVINDLNREEIVGTFFEKELQKKWKGDKLYVKWKGYHGSFNSWIDKKDIIKWGNIFQNRNLWEEEWKLN